MLIFLPFSCFRKVSRQEYLKKMEQKKLKELRDDIEDEQYLFDGVKLTKAEYGELRGAVAAVVCSLVLVLVKRCYCYFIVAATGYELGQLCLSNSLERNARIFSSVCTPANVAVRKVESLVRSPGSVLWSCLIFPLYSGLCCSCVDTAHGWVYMVLCWLLSLWLHLCGFAGAAAYCLLSALILWSTHLSAHLSDCGLSWEALQDERINGGAFMGTDGLQFLHKLIPVSFNLAMSLMSVKASSSYAYGLNLQSTSSASKSQEMSLTRGFNLSVVRRIPKHTGRQQPKPTKQPSSSTQTEQSTRRGRAASTVPYTHRVLTGCRYAYRYGCKRTGYSKNHSDTSASVGYCMGTARVRHGYVFVEQHRGDFDPASSSTSTSTLVFDFDFDPEITLVFDFDPRHRTCSSITLNWSLLECSYEARTDVRPKT
ncbi:hypothetical protein TEA_016489 [Camellia sinensis var. sinensis]|uniref:Uncharacterized protein n=1 Tax=Camellia sinensis var. sinensis TaxID=542762 RepID=A0A4S4E4Q1_CAMSN|nr:hypothetical protein TEA_016489 [Camellia sinensis var. sinensis]